MDRAAGLGGLWVGGIMTSSAARFARRRGENGNAPGEAARGRIGIRGPGPASGGRRVRTQCHFLDRKAEIHA